MTKKCKGCGSILQTKDKEKEGYINKKVIEKSEYCERCFKITHYGEASVLNTRIDIEILLKEIEKKGSKVLYLIDSTTISKETTKYIDKIKNEKYIILTKRDLLPKSVKDNKLKTYIKENINNSEVYIISSEKMLGIEELYNTLSKDKEKEFYLIGFTNSGKSSLINSFLKLKGKDALITASNMPNTTTDLINITFDEFTLIDTPGFTSNNSLCEKLEYKEYKKLLSKKEIKPKIHTLKPNFMIYIDDLIRIENISSNPISLIFYLNNEIKLNKMRIIRNNLLKDLESQEIKANSEEDIVIEGLGFIKVVGSTKLKIYTLNKNVINIRPKLI